MLRIRIRTRYDATRTYIVPAVFSRQNCVRSKTTIFLCEYVRVRVPTCTSCTRSNSFVRVNFTESVCALDTRPFVHGRKIRHKVRAALRLSRHDAVMNQVEKGRRVGVFTVAKIEAPRPAVKIIFSIERSRKRKEKINDNNKKLPTRKNRRRKSGWRKEARVRVRLRTRRITET